MGNLLLRRGNHYCFFGRGSFSHFFVVANVKDCFLMSTTFLIIRAFAYIFPALLIERRERQPPSLSLSLSLFSSFEEQLFERPAHLFFCKLRLLTFFSRKVSERQRKKALPFFSPSFFFFSFRLQKKRETFSFPAAFHRWTNTRQRREKRK